MFCIVYRLAGSVFRTCCNDAQATAMSNSLRLLEDMLGRCPSCMSNIRIPFCYMTCAPYQKDFLEPLEYRPATLKGQHGNLF